MHAAIRLDLGHVLANNVLVNSSIVGETIANANGNAYLYTDLTSNGGGYFEYPVYSLPETVIDVQFQCKFKFAKSWAEIMISVFVATVSMFGTGWGVAMLVASYFAKKATSCQFVRLAQIQELTWILTANACEAHAEMAQRLVGSEHSTQDIERGLSYNEKTTKGV
jgi:hypothetical protein